MEIADEDIKAYRDYVAAIEEDAVFTEANPARLASQQGRWNALKQLPPSTLKKEVNRIVVDQFREVLCSTGIRSIDFRDSPIMTSGRATSILKRYSAEHLTVVELVLFLSTMQITPQFFFYHICREMEELIRNPTKVKVESTEELNRH